MRIKYIIIGHFFALNLLLQPLLLWSQTPIEIINAAYLKCNKVQSGYFESTRCIKPPTVKDTVWFSYKCYFSRMIPDSIYCRAFHCYFYYLNGVDKGEAEVLYTGKDFVYTLPKDSTAVIRSTSVWAEDLRKETFQYKFFEPLISCKSFPFLDENGKMLDGCLVDYFGNESIFQYPCYHIRIIRDAKNFPEIMKWKVLSMVYDYWISISDSIPLQYTVSSKHLIANDTLPQYEKYTLNKYTLNQVLNDSIFTLTSIPPFYKIRTFSEEEPKKLLSTNSIAPDWSLISLNGEKISLHDYRGKVLLIDFFYQSCYPCRLALPRLVSLYNKYKENGLVVIGIDPVEKRNQRNELAAFLSKHEVNYPVLLDANEVANQYNVGGYPTFYLIDKTGKILFSLAGYGPELDKVLEDLILKVL